MFNIEKERKQILYGSHSVGGFTMIGRQLISYKMYTMQGRSKEESNPNILIPLTQNSL